MIQNELFACYERNGFLSPCKGTEKSDERRVVKYGFAQSAAWLIDLLNLRTNERETQTRGVVTVLTHVAFRARTV